MKNPLKLQTYLYCLSCAGWTLPLPTYLAAVEVDAFLLFPIGP